MRQSFRLVLIGVMAIILLSPGDVGAVQTFEGISGSTTAGAIKWFWTDRYIDDSTDSGWDVAFKQSTGPADLMLGTHNCNQGDAGPLYAQTPGVYEPVRPSLPTNYMFCLFSWSGTVTGSFSGTLNYN